MVILATLRVTDDHVLNIERFQELGGNLASEGSTDMGRNILSAKSELELVGRNQRLHRTEVGERGEYGNLGLGEVVSCVAQAPGQLLNEGDRLQVVEVHLPVAGDERNPLGTVAGY